MNKPPFTWDFPTFSDDDPSDSRIHQALAFALRLRRNTAALARRNGEADGLQPYVKSLGKTWMEAIC